MAETKKLGNGAYVEAVGRRREASARVRMYTISATGTITVNDTQMKAGDILVNDKRIQEYFPGPVNQRAYMAPLRITNTTSNYAISIQVIGGGPQGQLNAAVHGIARALDLLDSEKNHTLLKKRGLLTRDARAKERRKAGFAHKARARKQSPKR